MKKTLLLLAVFTVIVSVKAQNIPILGAVFPNQTSNVLSTTGMNNNTTFTFKNTSLVAIEFSIAATAQIKGTGIVVAANSQMDASIAQLGGISAGNYLNATNKETTGFTVGTFAVTKVGPGDGTGNIFTCTPVQNLLPNWYFDAVKQNMYLCPTTAKVGIGTTNPGAKLDVFGDVRIASDLNVSNGIHAAGNISSSSDIYAGGNLFGNQLSINSNAGDYGYASLVTVNNDNTKAIAVQKLGGGDVFVILGDGSAVLKGPLGIGTTGSQGSAYKLAVNGTIRAKELLLEQTGWPDYVFAKGYKLMPLKELENFINQNKRLPEIPSASQVEEKGVSMGDMVNLQMQKIEQLTLYLIEEHNKVDELQKQLQAQQQEIKELKANK